MPNSEALRRSDAVRVERRARHRRVEQERRGIERQARAVAGREGERAVIEDPSPQAQAGTIATSVSISTVPFAFTRRSSGTISGRMPYFAGE